ncbi:MAG: hypothetical protein J2P57_19750, partial [Acidimicrobiaceae bacterium]|nr:hypothetical protein [Acidimicrobiaceae bacterium]
DPRVGHVRALNPGSVGLPGHLGCAWWMVIRAETDGLRAHHREVAFDVDEVLADLHQRSYPDAVSVESVLTDVWPWSG